MTEDREQAERDNEEENVYSEGVREDLVDSGEISAEEEGFMAGYDEADDNDEDKIKDPDEIEED